MAGFMGKFKGDATAVRKKKFAEGTLRYNLYKQTKETLKSGINLKQVRNDVTHIFTSRSFFVTLLPMSQKNLRHVTSFMNQSWLVTLHKQFLGQMNERENDFRDLTKL